MEQGLEVGSLAKNYFNYNFFDVEKEVQKKYKREDKKYFPEQLEISQEKLCEKKTLFEPSFIFESLYVKCDILKYENENYNLIEVKASTRVKEENICDVAFQYFVLSKKNIKINKCFLMYVNKKFIKTQKEINLEEFFIIEDITEKVLEKQKEVEKNIELFLKVINMDFFDENFHNCTNLKRCVYKDLITPKIDAENFCNLVNISEKKIQDLKNLNFTNIKEIEEDKIELSEKQKIQNKFNKI